jgi:formyl-CoA transferase
MATRTTAQALEDLAAAKIPAGPVLNLQEVLDDPHVRATGLYRSMRYPGIEGDIPVAEPGARFSGFDLACNPPPTVGEHTDEILTQLFYTKAEIAQLRQAGVV